MRSAFVFIVLVLVLLAGGEALRRAASAEALLATADEQLTTSGATSRATDDAIDGMLADTARLPIVGPSIDTRVRRNRATQAYWQREYEALTNGPLAPSDMNTDPVVAELAANASFRQAVAVKGTPQALAKGLDDVLKRYSEVLSDAPGDVDAAYNYELVTRLRSALAGGRMSGMPDPEARGMQGEAGEPPQGTRKSDFNVIVPMRPEERQEQLDPGTGAQFQRKG